MGFKDKVKWLVDPKNNPPKDTQVEHLTAEEHRGAQQTLKEDREALAWRKKGEAEQKAKKKLH